MTTPPRVYMAYRPSQTMHVAAPLFAALRKRDCDVFADIAGNFDEINRRQIMARPHTLIVLTPGSLINDTDDPLYQLIAVALEARRNVVGVLARGFDFRSEADNLTGALAALPNQPHIYMVPQQQSELIHELMTNLLAIPGGVVQPALPEDETEVRARIDNMIFYAETSTTRLDTEKLFFRGTVRAEQGDPKGALSDFKRVTEENPYNEAAFLQLGKMQYALGQPDDALKSFEQAVHLSPKLVDAQLELGQMCFELARYRCALEAFDEALTLRPDLPAAVGGAALARHAIGLPSDGARLWLSLIAMDDRYRDVQFVVSQFGWNAAMEREARTLLEIIT